jgi:hypothetical protein
MKLTACNGMLFFFFEFTRASSRTLSRQEHNRKYSLLLLDVGETEASSWKQMLRTAVKRCCKEVPYIHGCLHCLNTPHIPDEAPLDCHHMGSLRDTFNRPSICQ